MVDGVAAADCPTVWCAHHPGAFLLTRGLAVVGGESCGVVDGVACADRPTGLVRPPPWPFPPHSLPPLLPRSEERGKNVRS